MSEPTPRNIAKTRIFGARTREEIDRAREVIREWVEEHPEDRFEFGKYASDLWTIEQELDEKERRYGGDEASSMDPSS